MRQNACHKIYTFPSFTFSMNNASRNRNHPDHKYEQRILKTDLCTRVVSNMQELVTYYPTEFGLNFLSRKQSNEQQSLEKAIETLYSNTEALFKSNNVAFDNHLVKKDTRQTILFFV